MRDAIILGTGGCAAEVTFYIEDHNSKVSEGERINILGYIDYEENIKPYYEKYNFKAPVLCDIDVYEPKTPLEIIGAYEMAKSSGRASIIIERKDLYGCE